MCHPAHLLHAVVHRQQRLHPPALQHVGELHVDGLHGSRVAQDPVLVQVGSVVVTWSSGKRVGEREREERGKRGREGERDEKKLTPLCLLDSHSDLHC